MKAKLLALSLSIAILFISCDHPHVIDDERIFVKGRVLDDEREPIQNVSVHTEAYTFFLGETLTDSNGYFEFTSLAAHNDNFKIIINDLPEKYSANNENNYLPQYSEVEYQYQESEFQSSYFLATTILKSSATLDLKIEKTTTNTDTLYWSLNFKRPYCKHVIGEIPNEIEEESCYENNVKSGRLTDQDPNYESKFYSILETQAVFTYKINEQEEESINIPLDQTNTNYVFEY